MTKSLGALLALCLAGLQFIAVVAVVFSSFLTSERALLQHARELLRDVGTNTSEHSRGFLEPAGGAAELAARLAQNRVVASDDPALLEQLLFQQLQIAPQFAGLYFGGEDGTFVMVSRSPGEPGPFRSKFITVTGGQRVVELIWRDDDFNIIERRFDPDDPYDPRTRLWYIQARAELETIWTDPYIFFTSQQPGITLAAPVLRDAGAGAGQTAVRGVVGVDIEISAISNFLARLNIGENGKALILHRNGDVIAHPNPELLKTVNEDGTLRFAVITEFDDPIARAAFSPLLRGGEVNVTETQTLQFSYRGESYVATVMPIIAGRLPWTIAVYAPESDFTAGIRQNRTQNLWIAAGVAILTGLAGLWLADVLSRPVRAFAIRSSLIAQGEIDPTEPQPRTYRELESANRTLVREIAARRDAEREYGQTFDLAARAMAQVVAGTGAFMRVNSRFCDLTGYSQLELQQMRIGDLLAADDTIATADGAPGLGAARSGEATADGMIINQEMRCLRKDGNSFWVAVNSITIHDRDGKALHAVVTMEDVTEARHHEEQISRLNRELSHLARGNTMGQMASGLAHELNQPLTAIAQNADTALLILDDAGKGDGELREILDEIERQSLRAGEIIRALRSFIRKDEGVRAGFDFRELLDQALRLIQAEIREAGVEIVTGIAPDLPQVQGNRVQIAQVLINLLRNATEAMASDGDNRRRILLSAVVEAGQLAVTVEDTGPGIPEGVNLFAQFETTKPQGMGLGLSICRSIVESNGGKLWYEMPPERGARFCFTVPLLRRV